MAQKLDILAFNTLFNECYRPFVRFAFSYLDDLQESEDIVSDSFAYYWDHRDMLSQDLNSKAYVLTVVKHKCLNALRHQDVMNKASEKMKQHYERILSLRIATLEASDPEELLSKEAVRIVNDTMARLPEKTRRIFTMSRIDNKTYSEIAESLSISVKSVEFHISKALKFIKANLPSYFLFF